MDKSWPIEGIATSSYSMHKVAVERLLDRFEREHPAVRVVRLRPGLIFKREAGPGIRRLFAGPLLPSPLVRPGLVPIVTDTPRLRFQAVHSLDVGEAYCLAATRDVRGPFNIAAEPVLDPRELGRLLSARPVPVPVQVLRRAAQLSWRLRLQPSPVGWVDLALGVPLLDTTRRPRRAWLHAPPRPAPPRRDAGEALLELLGGIRDSAGIDTPPLAPDAGREARVREFLTGVGRWSF